jgi:hypothetical protein
VTYLESADGQTITHARALRELAKHGITDGEALDDFYRECGRHETYLAFEVLLWLGY